MNSCELQVFTLESEDFMIFFAIPFRISKCLYLDLVHLKVDDVLMLVLWLQLVSATRGSVIDGCFFAICLGRSF